MTYYIKGGSKYEGDPPANPKVWVGLFLGGFSDDKYSDANWKNIDYNFGGTGAVVTNDDPFWRMGGSSGGAKEFELGLWNDNRIKVDTSGYWYWDGDSFEDLITAVGPHDLDSHSDVIITTPADNEVLAWDNATTKWINQTPAEAGLQPAGSYLENIVEDVSPQFGGNVDGNTKTLTNIKKITISSDIDGKLELQTTTDGGTPGTPEGGWNYIEFLDSDGDRQGYFGIDNAGNFQFSPEVAGAKIEMEAEVNLLTHKITGLTNGSASSDAMAFGQKYADADAVSAVESTGLTMGNSINLQENTLTVGDAGVTDPITLITFETERSWYFRKRNTGATTTLNLECDTSGKSFKIGYTNLPIMSFNTNSVDASQTINAHNHKITNLANGSSTQDAMAYGQKYTLEQHDNTYHSTNYLANVVEDISPQLARDLDCQNYDVEKVGTVYHTDATRWLTRISSTGFDTGTLYDIGIKWDTGTNKQLEVVGYNNLYLGIRTDHDIVDINASGMRIGGTNARINEISTDGTLGGNSDVAVPTEKAVKTYVDAAGGGGFSPPIGFITMFSGTWVDNSTIPGWYKCDGANGTVNLVGKFVRGGATSGTTGGSDNAVVVSHRHGILVDTGTSLGVQYETTAGSNQIHTEYSGVSGVGKNIPAYYTLIFIQRIS